MDLDSRGPGPRGGRRNHVFRSVTVHAVNDVTLPCYGETLSPDHLKGMSPTAHAVNDVGIPFGPLDNAIDVRAALQPQRP